MHALLVSVKIDPAQSDGALERLRSQVVPAVKQAPGLVAGYWLAPASMGGDLVGYSTVVFDSEDKAHEAGAHGVSTTLSASRLSNSS
jgi:hypothetical protein